MSLRERVIRKKVLQTRVLFFEFKVMATRLTQIVYEATIIRLRAGMGTFLDSGVKDAGKQRIPRENNQEQYIILASRFFLFFLASLRGYFESFA